MKTPCEREDGYLQAKDRGLEHIDASLTPLRNQSCQHLDFTLPVSRAVIN